MIQCGTNDNDNDNAAVIIHTPISVQLNSSGLLLINSSSVLLVTVMKDGNEKSRPLPDHNPETMGGIRHRPPPPTPQTV